MNAYRVTRLAMLAATASLGLALTACDNDPAKDKSRATVSEPVAAAQASATPPMNAAAAPANGKVLTFSQDGSKVTFVGAKVTRKHDGSFQKFTGTITLVGNDATKSSVTADIDTASIDTDTPKLTGHLKTGDFFDVEKFPKASFHSTAITAGGDKGATNTITGVLDLHGASKQISFPANIKVAGDTVDVDAEFAINRKDFGLSYPGMADDLIKDDVLIKLSIHAKPKS